MASCSIKLGTKKSETEEESGSPVVSFIRSEGSVFGIGISAEREGLREKTKRNPKDMEFTSNPRKKKKNDISPAQEFKRMVMSSNLMSQPVFHFDRKHQQPPILDTFINFAPILSDCAFRETLMPITEDDFAGPNQVPKYYKFQSSHWEKGLTVTISYFESPSKIFIFDHADIRKLQDLETEMSQWYGNYLMRKCIDDNSLNIVFDIVPRGYYAVYLEHVNIWARCYVESILPCNPREGLPEQKICVVLFDYDGTLQVYPRKYFLPLKKTFLDVPVQKIVGNLDHVTKYLPPWNCHNLAQIRQAVEGKQFHAYMLNYNTSTEPFPVLSMGLTSNSNRNSSRPWDQAAAAAGTTTTGPK